MNHAARTKSRMKLRMTARRKRILAHDSTLRFFRSWQHRAAALQIYNQSRAVADTTATTDEDKAMKKLELVKLALKMVTVTVECAKVLVTPTEAMDRL